MTKIIPSLLRGSFILVCTFFSLNASGQVTIYPLDCTSLEIDITASSFSNSKKVILERQIIPNVWAKITEAETSDNYFVFTDLLKGEYRVTVVDKQIERSVSKAQFSKRRNWISKNISNVIMLECESPASQQMSLKKELHIYPNPSDTKIWIVYDSWSEPIDVLIVDPQGRTSKAFSLEQAKMEIDISSLVQGVYFISLDSVLSDEQVRFLKTQ